MEFIDQIIAALQYLVLATMPLTMYACKRVVQEWQQHESHTSAEHHRARS